MCQVERAAERVVVEGTLKTRALCEEISRLAHGVCLLGFSRGKDSSAAWLYLRQFFERVIPFHVAAVPHLKFADESLAYYECKFGVPIERFQCGHALHALACSVHQPLEDREAIESLEVSRYDNHDIARVLRRMYKVPGAWCAFGIGMGDSIDRRIYVKRNEGRNPARRTFYPCFDWTAAQVLDAIRSAGLLLPDDYRFAARSFAGVPTYRAVARMSEVCPDDWERVKTFWPFIPAQIARNEFRVMRQSGQPILRLGRK